MFRRLNRLSTPNNQLLRVTTRNVHHSGAHDHVSLKSVTHKHLLPQGGFINGQFTFGTASQNHTFPVINPATGKEFFHLPSMNEDDAKAAISAAKNAFVTWKETTAFERSAYLKKISVLMNKYKDDLAAIMTLEAGKPLAESKGEINYAISFVDFYAEEAIRIKGDTMQSPTTNKRLLTIKQPIGPCGLITPWNFPSAMITRKLAPALAAGCTAVIKPAEDTPLSALAICAIVKEAGLPDGVVNCVTVDRENVEAVGRTLCHSKDIKKISFTGSTPVGKWLMREASGTVKKVSLELGGNAPFIVFEDADLDNAVSTLMFSKFRNAGQVCIASNRIMVQESIYEKFAEKLTAAVKKLQVGEGFDSATSLGPLINEKGLHKVIFFG
jgi:succinate-semialdehyde dehydrogenase/glutarate-semialdehyde dehydrogenase